MLYMPLYLISGLSSEPSDHFISLYHRCSSPFPDLPHLSAPPVSFLLRASFLALSLPSSINFYIPLFIYHFLFWKYLRLKRVFQISVYLSFIQLTLMKVSYRSRVHSQNQEIGTHCYSYSSLIPELISWVLTSTFLNVDFYQSLTHWAFKKVKYHFNTWNLPFKHIQFIVILYSHEVVHLFLNFFCSLISPYLSVLICATYIYNLKTFLFILLFYHCFQNTLIIWLFDYKESPYPIIVTAHSSISPISGLKKSYFCLEEQDFSGHFLCILSDNHCPL